MHTSSTTGEPIRPRTLNGHGQAEPAGSVRESPLSVIGADILVTGNIDAEVDLQIEGRVVGDVRCATLILGERSSINGNIFAQRVRVSGLIEGAIETTDLAIESTARVKGEISYSRLRIANGGVVEGSMIHRPLTEEQLAEMNRLKLVQERSAEAAAAPSKVHYIE